MTLFGITYSLTIMGVTVGGENYITKEDRK